MKRWLTSSLLAALAACASDPAEEAPAQPEPAQMQHDQYAGYHVDRTGCVKFIGYFEPIVTVDETYIQYTWRFRGAPAQDNASPVLLYVDHAKSGYNMGVWRNKKIIAVGRLHPNQTVGHERTPGNDTKKFLLGDVLELVSIDTHSDDPEKLPSRVKPNYEEAPEKK